MSLSLVGQLPLAAIWFQCKNLEESKKFYRDVVGLRPFEEEEGIHFDLGNTRLSLLQRKKQQEKHGDGKQAGPGDHLVFIIENHFEAVCDDLAKRGAKLKPKKPQEDAIGKASWFEDPDGHVIYLWQPPKKDSKNFKNVEPVIAHYESITRALADLREEDMA